MNKKFAKPAKIILLFLFFISPPNVDAMQIKKDVTQQEIAKYTAIAVKFIEKTKGWAPEDYIMRYRVTLANAPLAVFNVIRYDAKEDMRQRGGLGSHPTGELQVFVHTEEMRAFSDYEEANRIRREGEEKYPGKGRHGNTGTHSND